ncbi:MAG: hypothetical protein IT294_02980 [Deltaproteobacteria bacterium]|nr:hypothetical protein [Deltaproteobacteria bacterium]
MRLLQRMDDDGDAQGIPRTLERLLALTIVVEERALSRYLRRVFVELERKERATFGFSVANAPAF